MQRTNPKRIRKQPVKFSDEQLSLMGRDVNGDINKYHYRKNPYDREYDGDDYDYFYNTNEIRFNINKNSNTKSCGYEIDNFVVENDDNIFEKDCEDEEDEEFEFEDSEEEEEEDEDSEEEEE
jgi:hypothetical protein